MFKVLVQGERVQDFRGARGGVSDKEKGMRPGCAAVVHCRWAGIILVLVEKRQPGFLAHLATLSPLVP